MYIEKINSPKDLKQLDLNQMEVLSQEIRNALIFRLSRHGGHLAPNLGIVETTMALHYVFNSPDDKIIFDVSHQCYVHKILTGRKDAYLKEECFEDVSGYSNPDESEHDFFTVGHTSTSVSLACGMAKARDLNDGKENIIAVIGDGSLSGGEALEGFDFAGEMNSNLIIVVNDNDMSIAENHGGLYKNLKLLRETKGTSECNIFKAMGLDYMFVEDGNNLSQLIPAFEKVKDSTKPVVVHIVTQKGKGYVPAQENRELWHWCMPFDEKTGKSRFETPDNYEDFGTVTRDYLLDKMAKDKTVCAITSATPAVFGFSEDIRKQAGKQFIDVGIAEEHAVAMASAMAKGGAKPFYGVYSSFIQRTYDQLSQDLCINNNAVTIAVFAASIYGMNDITHLGIYDIPMLSNIPNLVYIAPTNRDDYLAVLDWAMEQNKHPVAVRVPLDISSKGEQVKKDFGILNKYEVTQSGSDIAVIALGSFYSMGEKAAEFIKQKTGVAPTLINPYYITGIDEELLESLKANHKTIITIEDGILDGGFGEKISRFYGSSNVKTLNFGLKKEFLDRYNPDDVLKANHLTPEQIAEDTLNV